MVIQRELASMEPVAAKYWIMKVMTTSPPVEGAALHVLERMCAGSLRKGWIRAWHLSQAPCVAAAAELAPPPGARKVSDNEADVAGGGEVVREGVSRGAREHTGVWWAGVQGARGVGGLGSEPVDLQAGQAAQVLEAGQVGSLAPIQVEFLKLGAGLDGLQG